MCIYIYIYILLIFPRVTIHINEIQNSKVLLVIGLIHISFLFSLFIAPCSWTDDSFRGKCLPVFSVKRFSSRTIQMISFNEKSQIKAVTWIPFYSNTSLILRQTEVKLYHFLAIRMLRKQVGTENGTCVNKRNSTWKRITLNINKEAKDWLEII
jgi:hypothetical protein